MFVRGFTVLLTLSFVLVSGLFAFDFDEQRWRQDARNLIRLDDYSVELREEILAFAKEHQKIDVISGDDHLWLRKIVDHYARLRGHLEKIRMNWEAALPERAVPKGELNSRILGCALYAGASTSLLENAAIMVDSFNNSVWEWRLNRPIIGKGEVRIARMFEDMHEAFVSHRGRSKIQSRLDFLEEHMKALNLLILQDDGVFEDVLRIIAASQEIYEDSSLGLFGSIKKRLSKRFWHLHSFFSKRFLSLMHKIFLFAEGDPYADKEKEDLQEPSTEEERLWATVHNEMISLLEPGDILVEKKRGTIADILIPGFWGHTALWLGDDSYLEAIGAYDSGENKMSHLQAKKHRPYIQRGRQVIEAVFTGVIVNTLEHFLNCDTVAVLRLKDKAIPRDKTRSEAVAEIVKRAIYHAGQEYDFWFNVNTSNTIVCSE